MKWHFRTRQASCSQPGRPQRLFKHSPEMRKKLLRVPLNTDLIIKDVVPVEQLLFLTSVLSVEASSRSSRLIGWSNADQAGMLGFIHRSWKSKGQNKQTKKDIVPAGAQIKVTLKGVTSVNSGSSRFPEGRVSFFDVPCVCGPVMEWILKLHT